MLEIFQEHFALQNFDAYFIDINLHSSINTMSCCKEVCIADDYGPARVSSIVTKWSLPRPVSDVGIVATYHTLLLPIKNQ